VTLLRGEVVANAADGRGSLTIEYETRIPAPDTAGRRREAAALVRVLTPAAGSPPFALVRLRACAPAGEGRWTLLESLDFVQSESGGAWMPRPRPARRRS
jgi:hypothetical protein